MRLTTSLLAYAGLASAGSFQDTSPFVFFSTSEVLASPPQIASSSSLTKTLTTTLSKCLTDIYLIAHAPGVSATDFLPSTSAHCATCLHPYYLSGKNTAIRSSFSVAQVQGQISTTGLSETLIDVCGASTTSLDPSTGIAIGSTDAGNVTNPRIISVELPSLPAAEGPERREAERENERLLSNLIEAHGGKSFTVLLTTSPASAVPGEVDLEYEYEMENSQVPINMELKRDLAGRKSSRKDDDKPLFEKYQYFTPALFSGLLIFVLLASILYVAISAISSVTVSYAAFDKENGPQAQRKQQ